MRHRLALAILFLAIGAAGALWYSWSGGLGSFLQNTSTTAQQTLEQAGQLLALNQVVKTPPPLFGPRGGQLAELSADAVFELTNRQRTKNDVAMLRRNTTLDAAATNKMKDLFARQYFDHVSPTGEGPADVIGDTGYTYIRVGENLALGNFPSDADLVQAWMDSPGHRANILDDGFQEIGISVGQGMYEGEQTWIAVQSFGTPASLCTMPDVSLTTAIESNKQTLADYEQTLSAMQPQIEALIADSNTKIEAGNEEINTGNTIYQETGDKSAAQPHWDAGEQLQAEGKTMQTKAQTMRDKYNQLAEQATSLAKQTQQLVDSYNEQVRMFNTCVESYS